MDIEQKMRDLELGYSLLVAAVGLTFSVFAVRGAMLLSITFEVMKYWENDFNGSIAWFVIKHSEPFMALTTAVASGTLGLVWVRKRWSMVAVAILLVVLGLLTYLMWASILKVGIQLIMPPTGA